MLSIKGKFETHAAWDMAGILVSLDRPAIDHQYVAMYTVYTG